MSLMNAPQSRQPELPEEREQLEGYWDERRPIMIVDRSARERRDPFDVALRVLAGLSLLLVVALLVVILMVAVSMVGVGNRLGDSLGGLGSGLSGAVEGAGAGIGQATRSVADRFDPAHPPRGALVHDVEFDELTRVNQGATIGRSGDYVVTLVEITKREGASGPNEAQYAVVRRHLETPRETRVLGLLIRTDHDESTYYLYKGESFRLGHSFYKVNWVSFEQRQMAIARYRNADNLSAPLKFQID
jgi:hypothetical protein